MLRLRRAFYYPIWIPSVKGNGFNRTKTADDEETGYKQDQKTNHKCSQVHPANLLPVDSDCSSGNEIRILRQRDKSISMLEPADQQAEKVSQEDASKSNECPMIKKYLLYVLVPGTHRFQQSDHMGSFEQQNDQAGYKVQDSNHYHHDDNNDNGGVLQVEPVENTSVDFCNGMTIPLMR